MRLSFTVKFHTAVEYNEVYHYHDVAVCNTFKAAADLLEKLEQAANARVQKDFPKKAAYARYFIDEHSGGSKLDPQFQVLSGFWRYYIEPVVVFEDEELSEFPSKTWKAQELLAQGWQTIRAHALEKVPPQAPSTEVSTPEPTTRLGQLLKEKIEAYNRSKG